LHREPILWRFHKLMSLRDRGEHLGELPAEALAKMIPLDDGGISIAITTMP
jgi:hypothetical protein